MPVKVYWLKDGLSYKDRIPRKVFDSTSEIFRVVTQAPWIWFGLVSKPGEPEESIEWQGCSIHNVARVEGEPDSDSVGVEPLTRSTAGSGKPARTKEQAQ